MKKFQFSLETVLDYKNQVLSSLQNEHGAILAQLHAQEEILENLKILEPLELIAKYQKERAELNQKIDSVLAEITRMLEEN